MNLTLIPVEPIAREKTMAFVNPEGLREVEVDRYPPSPRGEALLRFRLLMDLGLRECSKMLCIHPSELSALENSRATLSDADWLRVFVGLSNGCPPEIDPL